MDCWTWTFRSCYPSLWQQLYSENWWTAEHEHSAAVTPVCGSNCTVHTDGLLGMNMPQLLSQSVTATVQCTLMDCWTWTFRTCYPSLWQQLYIHTDGLLGMNMPLLLPQSVTATVQCTLLDCWAWTCRCCYPSLWQQLYSTHVYIIDVRC